MGIVFNSAWGVTADLYSFASPQQQQRFDKLTGQFRCLVCQNESLADSNAPLAKDLRFEIYQMVKSSKTNQEIKQYLVQRYGAFVLFRPPVDKYTYALWFGPFIMLMIALARLFWLLRKRKTSPRSFTFSPRDRERIKHLLNEH